MKTYLKLLIIKQKKYLGLIKIKNNTDNYFKCFAIPNIILIFAESKPIVRFTNEEQRIMLNTKLGYFYVHKFTIGTYVISKFIYEIVEAYL